MLAHQQGTGFCYYCGGSLYDRAEIIQHRTAAVVQHLQQYGIALCVCVYIYIHNVGPFFASSFTTERLKVRGSFMMTHETSCVALALSALPTEIGTLFFFSTFAYLLLILTLTHRLKVSRPRSRKCRALESSENKIRTWCTSK